jgi:hypothetical protein
MQGTAIFGASRAKNLSQNAHILDVFALGSSAFGDSG